MPVKTCNQFRVKFVNRLIKVKPGGASMPTSIKLCGEKIDTVDGVFGAKAAFYGAVALLYQNSYLNAFYGARIVNKALGVLFSGACFFVNTILQQANAYATIEFEL